MVSVGRILRDYTEAGERQRPARALGLRGRHDVPDEGWARGRRLSVRASTTRPDARAAASLVHQFEAALRLLDEHCRLYQYLVKRRSTPFVLRRARSRWPRKRFSAARPT